ncbi:esterase/lipase family protein [Candidatus Hodarchaeum mangrovi]
MSPIFKRPKFVDVTSETQRLKELDHFWIQISEIPICFRFSYLSDDESGEYIPAGDEKARFNEPILMIHGHGTSHTIFNWFARELWYYGFRSLFAIDTWEMDDLKQGADKLIEIVNYIQEVTTAHRISIVAYSTGGIISRYYTKFNHGDTQVRILAMVGTPHDKVQYLQNLIESKMEKVQIQRELDYLEDINSTITEKELYYLTNINIGGALWARDLKSNEIRFVPLSDAINITLGRTQLRVHKHKITFRVLRDFFIPKVAVFKIRLLAITNTLRPLGFRIHYKGHITQRYPQSGFIKIPSMKEKQSFIPEVPIIIFSNFFSLEQNEDINLTIFSFDDSGILQKTTGKVDISIKYTELPAVDYFTLHGTSNEQISLAVYTYIP